MVTENMIKDTMICFFFNIGFVFRFLLVQRNIYQQISSK